MEKLWNFTKAVIPGKKQVQQDNLLLPSSIGCRIIQLQMQIQSSNDLEKQLIIQLLHEYTKAVQFYQERGDQKYKLYDKKMKNLLKKQSINSILNGAQGTMIMKRQRAQEEIRNASSKAKVVAQQIMETSQTEAFKQQLKIKKQLQNQQQNLQQRQKRRKDSVTKNKNSTGFQNSITSLPPKAQIKVLKPANISNTEIGANKIPKQPEGLGARKTRICFDQ